MVGTQYLSHFFGLGKRKGVVVLGHGEVILPLDSYSKRCVDVRGNQVNSTGRKGSLSRCVTSTGRDRTCKVDVGSREDSQVGGVWKLKWNRRVTDS